MTIRDQKEADRLRQVALELSELLPRKSLAYGAAHARQRELWAALLKPYLTDGGRYDIPAALMDHVPRITRVLDRLCRILANPAADPMGEDPWMDLAGDAIAGVSMPRQRGEPGAVGVGVTCDCGFQMRVGGRCERPAGHDGSHRSVHSGGIFNEPQRTVTSFSGQEHPFGFDAAAEGCEDGEVSTCGKIIGITTDLDLHKEACVLPPNHDGYCRDARGRGGYQIGHRDHTGGLAT